MKPARKPNSKPRTIAGYLARLPGDQRVALERLRRLVHAAAPGAEECISYGVPAVRLDGKVLVWFAAATRHCSFFPGAVVAEFATELGDFSISKGTVRFQPDRPLPAALVRKLVRARMARLAADGRARKVPPRAHAAAGPRGPRRSR